MMYRESFRKIEVSTIYQVSAKKNAKPPNFFERVIRSQCQKAMSLKSFGSIFALFVCVSFWSDLNKNQKDQAEILSFSDIFDEFIIIFGQRDIKAFAEGGSI